MDHKKQVFASLLLSGALLVPIGALAKTMPQDDHERHEQEEREHRVYDPYHKDYHAWDRAEDDAYRHWLEMKHEAYVDYNRLDRKRQREYWKWRHEHQEHEEHEHH
jgi:hypothetical protein